MEYFDDAKTGKKTIVQMDCNEGKVIFEVMVAYVKANPRKIKAKKLLAEMGKYWSLF